MKEFLKDKVLFWDFDGVILDSMDIRDKGFEIVLKDYPQDQVDQLLVYHRQNGGLSRYVKFRYFFEEIRNEKITEDQVFQLASQFSEVMIKSLGKPELLINDSLNYIKNNYTYHVMNIVSGSDQTELRSLCSTLGIDQYFKSICGSPTPKNQLIKDLLSAQKVDKSKAVLIGDSKNDYDAAETNGIDFIGYNNTELKGMGVGYIEKFSEL